jgi:CheY-like chemotaxis protein
MKAYNRASKNTNPILIIDDDADDCFLYEEALKKLHVKNKLIFYNSSQDAYNYLLESKEATFFILCDINMPGFSGIQLREKINKNTHLASRLIPFLFCSTSGAEALVQDAYALNIQGFFKKPSSIAELENMFTYIIEYWNCSRRPSATLYDK